MKQKTRATTRTGKSAEAVIKQIATQKFQAKKERMQEWKQSVMQEVVRELHATKKAHKEAMEAQRYGFQMELKKVIEELHQVESRSTRLEYEMNTLKGQKQTPEPRPTQDTLATQNAPIIPSSIKPPKGKEPTNPLRKSYAQMAASGSPKITTEKAWTEVTRSSRRRKATTLSTPKVKPEKRRVIFRQEALSPQKLEADLMLALNKSLQKAEIPAYTRFTRVEYLQSLAIFTLLTEKSSTKQLVGNHSNILIKAAKVIDTEVIIIEALKHWQGLKLHGISLARYLRERKIEFVFFLHN